MSLKLLWISGILLLVLVGLSALNERLLPLFGGDRALAGRAMLAVFALFGGLAFALAQPALWQGLLRMVQRRITQGGTSEHWLLRPEMTDKALTLGFGLLAGFALAAVVIAWLQWTGRA